MMGREQRSFSRISGIRSPSLIVIATEGYVTETQYFDGLRIHCRDVRQSNVKVQVLRREEPGNSSPRHVIDELNKYRQDIGITKGDELWMVIDKDRWSDRTLAELAQECGQKQYMLALSNPCFEIWLILHHTDLDQYNREQIELFKCNNNELKTELRRLLGSYNPSKINIDVFLPSIEQAVERAENCDHDKTARWPNSVGTRVYRIVKKLL